MGVDLPKKSPPASFSRIGGEHVGGQILWEHDATGLAALVHKGEVSPAELTDAAIARAEATQPGNQRRRRAAL